MISLASITYKNQLTIPKVILQALDWGGVRKVLVAVEDGSLVVRPLTSKVDELAGSLAKYARGRSTDFRAVRKEVQKRVAAEIAKEGF